jgi:hypothetical protein
MDVVSEVLFGHSFDLVNHDNEFPAELRMLADFVGDSGLIKSFPILKRLSKLLPSFLDKAGLEGYLYFQQVSEVRLGAGDQKGCID